MKFRKESNYLSLCFLYTLPILIFHWSKLVSHWSHALILLGNEATLDSLEYMTDLKMLVASITSRWTNNYSV